MLLLLRRLPVVRARGGGLQRGELAVLALGELMLRAEQLVGLVLVRLGDLAVGKGPVVCVTLTGSRPAKGVARGYKLGQVVTGVFGRRDDARYVVLQGEVAELLLAGTSLLFIEVELAVVHDSVFGRLWHTDHASVRLGHSLL